jgi:hypothetical protein
VILPFDREVLANSAAEALTRAIVTESLSLAFDQALLDTTAGSSTRPPGLRYNVPALAAAGAGVDAMKTDLSATAAAVAGAGGLSIVY